MLDAASWNQLIYVDTLPQGQSVTIFSARDTYAARSTGGGKSMALAVMEYTPTSHGSLGKDDYAKQIIAACRGRGIRIAVDQSDAATAHHLNLMDDTGGRYSIFLSNGNPTPKIDKTRIRSEIEAASTIFLSLSGSSKGCCILWPIATLKSFLIYMIITA